MSFTKEMSSDYNLLASWQKSMAKDGLERLRKGMNLSLLAGNNGSFNVLELGCATGGNSVTWIEEIKSLLGRKRQLHVVQEDLPSNHWSETLKTQELWVDDNTFGSVIGRSFYRPLVPDNSVDLCFSN